MEPALSRLVFVWCVAQTAGAGCVYPSMHVEADSSAHAGASSTGGAKTTGPDPGAAGNGGAANAGASQTEPGAGSGGLATGGSSATSRCMESNATCPNADCCSSVMVPGGRLKMGRSESPDGSDYYAVPTTTTVYQNEVPEHDVQVSAFALDRFEVTVGRFRRFLESYDAWHVNNPARNAGAHNEGDGTGWGASWLLTTRTLPADAAEFVTRLKSCG